MKVYTTLVGLFLISATLANAQQSSIQFYVAPGGNDSQEGSIDHPFATLTRARDAVRKVNRAMAADINVFLREGTYPLAEPLKFSSADSGFNGFEVVYQAYESEKPVISGGVPVTGWVLDHDQIYKARLDRDVKLRSLFVNGERAMVTQATFKALGPDGDFTIAGTEPWAETPGKTFAGIAFKATEVPVFINPMDVELTQRRTWALPIVCVQNVRSEPDKTILDLQQPYGAIAATMAWGCGIDPKGTFTIRNAFELLKKPGQFYFDRSKHTVYYFSKGEDMATAPVVAPLSEGLIRIAGSSTSDRAHNIIFKGITFSYDHWQLKQVGDSHGACGVQSVGLYTRFRADGNHHKDHYDMLDLPLATVELRNCDSIHFERNHFEHLSSGIGICLSNDVTNSVVAGNTFDDLSGNAVNVGHPQHYVIGGGPLFPPGIAGVCSHDVVKDNWIRKVSLDFMQEEGISAMFTEALTISHNDLQGLPYCGIAVGWWWADAHIPPSTVCKDNVISNNHIADTHKVLGGDGGALYVIGQQPGGLIQANYITGSPRCLFPDQGAAFWTITNNVVDTKSNWLNIFFASSHDIKIDNNYTNSKNILDHGTNCVVTNTHTETAPPWSSEAQAIIDKSGIEPEYRNIVPSNADNK